MRRILNPARDHIMPARSSRFSFLFSNRITSLSNRCSEPRFLPADVKSSLPFSSMDVNAVKINSINSSFVRLALKHPDEYRVLVQDGLKSHFHMAEVMFHNLAALILISSSKTDGMQSKESRVLGTAFFEHFQKPCKTVRE